MAHLVKPWQVRYVKDGRRVPKGTKGAKKVKERARKWYAQGVPGWPPKKRVPLASDKNVAKVMLADLVREAEKGGARMVDPFEAHNARPLLEHLSDYQTELMARDNCLTHVRDVIGRLKAIFAGCGFKAIPDLSASTASAWLAQQRQGKPIPPLPDGLPAFTLTEAAEALGASKEAVSRCVLRHRLAATGQGKARRFPRETVEAIRARLSRGASVQTTNHALTNLKSFCRWLVKDGRMAASPVAHLEAGNVATDRRHDRRELLAEELQRLLAVTRTSTRTFRGLDGETRFHLYATACATGFRAAALASLTPESFDLASAPPLVVLATRKNKSRKLKRQPLPPDVAELLGAFLKGKKAGKPLFGGSGTWARDRAGAEMLRPDLEAAGIAYEVPGPDGPLFADFHALRHTYLTLLGRGGVDLRTVQELAGHSTPVLTARYSHRNLDDLAAGVARLPAVLPQANGNGSADTKVQPDALTEREEALALGLLFYRGLLAVFLGLQEPESSALRK